MKPAAPVTRTLIQDGEKEKGIKLKCRSYLLLPTRGSRSSEINCDAFCENPEPIHIETLTCCNDMERFVETFDMRPFLDWDHMVIALHLASST